ncbi:MAG: phenylalanine--tRNA ligase subunit beta [candidate division WOR-3 bacterium]
MKVTYNWLKEYVDLNISPKELLEIFGKLGMPVEEFTDFRKGKENLMVAVIEDIERHKKKDNLFVLNLRTKKGNFKTISGAPFLEKGKKVIFAPKGTILKDYIVEEKVIRGEESLGTIVSEEELSLADKSETVIFLDEKISLEDDPLEILGLNDYIYELEIYPNRPDLLSVIGIARDISAYLNLELKIPEIKKIKEEEIDFKIEIEENAPCDRYVGLIIKDIKVKESSSKIKYRLNLCGIRAINSVVDATNYVMLETGHPLHAFDLNKIREKIIVRNAKKGEKILCLDSKLRELDDEVMVIADREKPLAIAGVIGGEESGVREDTRDILCESAFFEKINIRKTGKKLNIQTESSYRFERGADFEMVYYAACRLRDLILETSGGIPFKPIDVIKNEYKKKKVFLKEEKLKRILGNEFSLEKSKEILERLYIKSNLNNGILEAEIPSFRRDIEIEEDLIEEVARIYGYENFKSEAEEVSSFIGKRDVTEDRIREHFKGEGFLECVNISLIEEKEANLFSEKYLKIKNPLSERFSVLRSSLLPSLLFSLKNNLRKNEKIQKLFEIGKVFYENYSEEKKLGLLLADVKEENWLKSKEVEPYFELKGILESFFENFEDSLYFVEENFSFFEYGAKIIIDDKEIGFIGEVKEEILKYYDLKVQSVYSEISLDKIKLKDTLVFKPLFLYPSLSRDLSFVGSEEIRAQELIKALKELKRETLIEKFFLFDVYKGKPLKEGEKNFTFRVFFRSMDKTLSERDVDKEVEKIVKYIEEKTGYRLRG